MSNRVIITDRPANLTEKKNKNYNSTISILNDDKTVEHQVLLNKLMDANN